MEPVIDIEDITPMASVTDNPKDIVAIECVVRKMLETPINNFEEMDVFLRKEQKTHHIVLNAIKVLFVYKSLLAKGEIVRNKKYEQFLKTKKVRANSGVMVVTVVTSPWPATSEAFFNEFEKNDGENVEDVKIKEIDIAKKNKKFSCKFDCFYCPAEPGQPRSYLKKEPAVARANQHRFDPASQFRSRGLTYIINGLDFDKIELIVIGGTWSSYPKDYQTAFIRDLYYAANTFYDDQKAVRPPMNLESEIKQNEAALCRIIGLTLETRPDQINADEIIRFRQLGVTRVQLGIQHTDDSILEYINRGCTTADAITAIKLLKDNCYKIDAHLMPDLPGSSPAIDAIMFENALNNPDLQVDQYKIYPCSVVPWTKIERWYQNYKNGYDHNLNPEGLSKQDNRSYHPYAEDLDETIKIPIGKRGAFVFSSPLIELLIRVKQVMHPWIRINRLVRDIPGYYISGGNDREDLRHIIHNEMIRRGLNSCKCIRCREVRDKKTEIANAELFIREYPASDGTEYFISYETSNQATIYGFLRLRISGSSGSVFPELVNAALIRELHVYGQVVPVNSSNSASNATTTSGESQHLGFGKRLILAAEALASSKGYYKIAVIAGVGVRNYYRKQGYLDQPGVGNFQIKLIKPSMLSRHTYISPPGNVTINMNSQPWWSWRKLIMIIMVLIIIITTSAIITHY